MSRNPEIHEAVLHEIWYRQQLPPALLKTSDGQAIEIVNQGKRNQDAGPDFKRATLRIGTRIVQGDIEIHLNASHWRAHGHHRDPAYNNVVLHLAIREQSPPPEESPITRENGLAVPQLLLPASVLSLSQKAGQQTEALLECPLSRTTAERILATVRHAGILRLHAKAEAFSEQVASGSWDQAVYRGIAEALGYDKNQEPFRRLAELVPIELVFAELRAAREVSPELLVEALLFGAAGFLSYRPGGTPSPDAEIAAYLSERSNLWDQLRHTLQIRPLRSESWQFFRLRPQNFPSRRLAGLSAMILRFYRHGILERLTTLLQSQPRDTKAVVRELVSYFVCPAREFWASHYDFRDVKGTQHPAPGDLIGRSRALDIVVNVVTPALWLYYSEAGDASMQNRVQEIYCNLPKLQENRLTRAMKAQLSRFHSVARAVTASARCQQGLIHLQKLYCRPLRCDRCMTLP